MAVAAGALALALGQTGWQNWADRNGNNVIDVGAGSFTASGIAPKEGRPNNPANGGGWGITVTGNTVIDALELAVRRIGADITRKTSAASSKTSSGSAA